MSMIKESMTIPGILAKAGEHHTIDASSLITITIAPPISDFVWLTNSGDSVAVTIVAAPGHPLINAATGVVAASFSLLPGKTAVCTYEYVDGTGLPQSLIVSPSNEVAASDLPTRKKSEIAWSGLTGKTLTGGVTQNLIATLEGFGAPASGSFAPFFNTTTDKLNVYNDNADVTFKVSFTGTWVGGIGTSRSLQIDLVGTNGNRLLANRSDAVTTDTITLSLPLAVDKDGNLATNGSAITVTANGGDFSVSAVSLIAAQVTALTAISAV